MCASYGLDGGPDRYDFEPFSEMLDYTPIRHWQDVGGKANTTRVRKRDGHINLNPIIRNVDGHLRVDLAWWWFWVGGKPAEFTAFNSRDDKLLSSPVWKGAYKSRRALLPASWYVEKGKRFELPGGEPFTLGAIWNAGSEEVPVSYSMVTRDALATPATVWDRMPLIIPEHLREAWLDPSIDGDAALLDQVLAASEADTRELVIAG